MLKREKVCFVASIIVWMAVSAILLLETIRYQELILSGVGAKLFVQVGIFLVLAAAIFWQFHRMKMEKEKKQQWAFRFLVALFVLYVASLVFILFRATDLMILDMGGNEVLEWYRWELDGSNFVPFQVFADYSKYTHASDYFTQLIGNCVLFFPFGVMLPLIWKKVRSFKFFTVFTLVILVLVETVQFLTFNGNTDIDDVILNYFGALVGYCISKIILKKIFKREK